MRSEKATIRNKLLEEWGIPKDTERVRHPDNTEPMDIPVTPEEYDDRVRDQFAAAEAEAKRRIEFARHVKKQEREQRSERLHKEIGNLRNQLADLVKRTLPSDEALRNRIDVAQHEIKQWSEELDAAVEERDVAQSRIDSANPLRWFSRNKDNQSLQSALRRIETYQRAVSDKEAELDSLLSRHSGREARAEALRQQIQILEGQLSEIHNPIGR